MRKQVFGYWQLTWIGLIANVAVLPCIGFVAFSNPDLRLLNFILAISLAWPAAIVGIVASAGLLAERKWGIFLAIIALSMALAGSLPYGIVRVIIEGDIFGLSGLSFLMSIVNLCVLIYWCQPAHRKKIRL